MSDDPFGAAEPPGGVNYGDFGFQAKRWVLSGLVDAAVAALPANPALAALGCFRVRVSPGHLQLAATDMERTVLASSDSVISLGVPDDVYSEAFIPAKRLQAILRELGDVDVKVTVKKNQAEVNAGHGSWSLSLPDGSSYPALLDLATTSAAAYGRERLLAALRSVRHVVGKDASRPALTLVELKDDPLSEASVATAADGSRFARCRLERYPLPGTYIPVSVLDHLLRLLAGGQSDEVGVFETPEQLAFRVGPVVLAVAKRSTPFPDVDRLLLQPAMENEDSLSVDKDELAAAVRRVRINADGDSSAIALEVSESQVVVLARDKQGNSASESVPAVLKGKARMLCVSHVALSEMLAAHQEKTCVFRLGKDAGKRRSSVLLASDSLVQVIAQMTPSLVGY